VNPSENQFGLNQWYSSLRASPKDKNRMNFIGFGKHNKLFALSPRMNKQQKEIIRQPLSVSVCGYKNFSVFKDKLVKVNKELKKYQPAPDADPDNYD
jgi:hypothetical protein